MGHRPQLAAALAIAALVGLAAGCGGDGGGDEAADPRPAEEPAQPEQPLTPAQEHGKQLFVQHCGPCHTLEAAGTIGSVGPSLDEVPVDEQDVLEAIENGGRGSGEMPKNLVSGKDAEDVAAFVAASGPGV